MLYEFAVEPTCLADWSSFRYLIEQFGVSHGRLISRFPKDWIRSVIEHCGCGAFTFIQKKRLISEMERIKRHALIRSGRDYETTLSWQENALTQHAKSKPFHAIIVKEASSPENYLLPASDITQHDERWAIPRERKIPRTVDALSNAVAPLLGISDHIIFVDRLFRLQGSQAERWIDTLESFIHRGLNGRTAPPSFEYHFQIDAYDLGRPKEVREKELQEDANRILQSRLPKGTCMKLVRWTRWHDESDFFHARYILTDRGGIRIDWGLDLGKSGEKTDISLLDHKLWQECWESFQDGAKVFQLIDSVIVEGRKINP